MPADPCAKSSPQLIQAPAARLIEFIQTRLPWLFIVYALPAVVFLAVAMPPFQVPDEEAHTLRADQISRGKLISDRLGGTVEGSLVTARTLYRSMWSHPEVKQTAELAKRAGALEWIGPQERVNFQNTAQYGPLLYAPQAAGLMLGRWMNLRIAESLLLARLINGMVACVVSFWALSICRRGRTAMFVTLTLPMTLSQFGSISQDALIISLSLLVIAAASRILAEGRIASTAEFTLFAMVVMATTLARPSQIALAFLAPAFVTWPDASWRTKAIVAGLGALPIALWMGLLPALMPSVRQTHSVSLQLQYLLTHPFALPAAMWNSFLLQGWWLWMTVVGHLGWLDTLLPRWHYRAALFVLCFALIVPEERGAYLRSALPAFAALAGTVTAISFALYLTWTPLHKSSIDGLQGRYLLPVLPLLAWLIPGRAPRDAGMLRLAWLPVALFPLASLAILPGVIMARYYGSWQAMAESLQALLLS